MKKTAKIVDLVIRPVPKFFHLYVENARQVGDIIIRGEVGFMVNEEKDELTIIGVCVDKAMGLITRFVPGDDAEDFEVWQKTNFEHQ